jgi:hypothetical protein
VVKAEVPPDTEPGLKLAAAAVERMQSAKDALPALLPIGLGERAGEFDMVFLDTFKLIVLRGQNPGRGARSRKRGAEPPDDRDRCAVLGARSSQQRRVPGAVAEGA